MDAAGTSTEDFKDVVVDTAETIDEETDKAAKSVEDLKDTMKKEFKEALDAAKEFEALVKQAEKYEDLTTEEKLEIAAIQAQYAGIQANKGINMVIDDVKDLFCGKKNK